MDEFLLGDRDRQILTSVINEYILTAEPVGSRNIARRYDINLSSATIRNVMSDLEEMGFLHQPHTSAGRIPTERALRFYVDSILKVKSLDQREKDRIRKRYKFSELEASDLVRQTSEVLSVLSRHVSIVSAPKLVGTVLKHIEFIKISRDRILVIFVSQSGFVQNRIIEDRDDISQSELDKYTNYLGEVLVGVSLEGVRGKIEEEMKREKTAYDELLSKALELTRKVFGKEKDPELFMEGQVNLLECPEFSEVGSMKSLLQALEEKKLLLHLLDKTMDAEGIQIFIGSEVPVSEMQTLSVITSPYRHGEKVVGALGIIGPTRMNYLKLIPIVEYSAQLLTEFLNGKGSEL
jgi:heat-inducible transcriptional repressor